MQNILVEPEASLIRQYTALLGTERITLIGAGGASTAAWGHCDRDYPREAIVSPYSFERAEEHYAALLEETRGRVDCD